MNWIFYPTLDPHNTPDPDGCVAIAAWGEGKQRRYIFAAVMPDGGIDTSNPRGLDGVNGWLMGDEGEFGGGMIRLLFQSNAALEALIPGGIGAATLAVLRAEMGVKTLSAGRGGYRPGAGRKAK